MIVTIPSVLLPIGSRQFGPANVGTDESTITLTVDRTLTNGLNARPSTTTISVLFEVSFDGGTSWADLAWCSGFVGGITTTELSGQKDVDVFQCSVWNPGTPGRKARAAVTVAGSTVRVSGSLVVA